MPFRALIQFAADVLPTARRLNDWRDNQRYLKGSDGPVTLDDRLDVDGPIRVGQYTTAERAALPLQDGAIIVNTDENEFQHVVEGMWSSMGSAAPVGATAEWAGPTSSIPSGWLECDGSVVSRTTYAALFAAIGTRFGQNHTLYGISGNNLSTIDVHDPENPTLVGALPHESDSNWRWRGLAGAGHVLYALRNYGSSGAAGRIYAVDTSTPANSTIAVILTNSRLNSLGGVGSRLFGATSQNLREITISPAGETDLGRVFTGVLDSLAGLGSDLYSIRASSSADRFLRINPDDPDDETGDYGLITGDLPDSSSARYRGLGAVGGTLYAIRDDRTFTALNLEDISNSSTLGQLPTGFEHALGGVDIEDTQFLLPNVDTGDSNTVAVIKA